MEIYQLRTFLAIARTGHLTRAAEQLHLTQSAVSKQIKALEAELGVVLFERTFAGMALTKTGQFLLAQAEKTLNGAVELMAMAKQMQGEVSGSIRLGTIIDPEYLRLGTILGQLLLHYPKVDVTLSHGISGWVLEQLKNGAIDVGFCLGDLTGQNVGVLELSVLTYLVVAPTTFAEQIQAAEWSDIARMPWIGTPLYSSQNRIVKQMFREQGYEMTPVAEADQESSMKSLVEMGVGLCLLRDDVALPAQERGELVVWNKVQCPCPLSLIFLEDRINDVLVEAVKKIVQEVWTISGAT